MLSTFLSLPVVAELEKTNEAYTLAWRPAGAKRFTLGKRGELHDEPLTLPLIQPR